MNIKPNKASYASSEGDRFDESESLLEPVQDDSALNASNHKFEAGSQAPVQKEGYSISLENEKRRFAAVGQEEVDDSEIDPNPTPFERASLINVMHYIYIMKHICKLRNNKRTPLLSFDDTPRLGKTEEVEHKIIELETEYQRYHQTHNYPSLLWPLSKVFWVRSFYQQVLLTIFWIARILATLSLSKLLQELDTDEKAEYRWILCLFAAVMVNIYAIHLSQFYAQRQIAQLKPALIGLMYRKISRLSSYRVNQVNIGKIVNIVANDLNIFEYQMASIHTLAIAPFALLASLGILWSFFGVASIPGIIVLFLVSPFQYLLATLGAKYAQKKNLVTDERIKMSNEMIESIRLFKMYGWNIQYAESISKTRNQEISLLNKIAYCDYFGGHMAMRLSPVLSSFVIFLTYGLMGETLTASKVYSTITLLSLLRYNLISPVNIALRFIAETKILFKRIIQLLEIEEGISSGQPRVNRPPLNELNEVEFDDFSAFWGDHHFMDENSNLPAEATVEKNPTVTRLNFSVKRGTLCALIGRVGSGKTTTLLSFLNEVPKTTGNLRFSGRIAYVEQEPSIYPGTLRSNILFGKAYDERMYNQVIEAVCLIDDIKEFPIGDLSEIGEKGINLSVGQKARTSLARALYSDADIYLLDDPLSAVDTKVAQHIFEKAIRGMLRNKTVLLATHQVHFAREAEKIVVFENGEVKTEGTLDEIIRQNDSVMLIFETRSNMVNLKSEGVNLRSKDILVHLTSRKDSAHSSFVRGGQPSDTQELIDESGKALAPENESPELKGKLLIEEKDEGGQVGWGTYWFYLKNAGSFWFTFLFVINLCTIEILYVLYTRLIGYWTEGTWTPNFTLKILGTILTAFFLVLVLREVLFVAFGINASKQLHNKLLYSIAGAKVEFFDTNPIGRILNRFSNDVGVLDRYLLQVQDSLIDGTFFYLAIFITICVIAPLILLPGIATILFILMFLMYMKDSIISGRGIELLTRSPIDSLFSLTLSGLTSIRVYGQESRFIRDFTRLLNRSSRALNFYNEAARAFAFYCDLGGGIFTCIGIAMLVSFGDSNSSLIGLACSSFLSVAGQAQLILRQLLIHIMLMACTARIKGNIEIKQEPASILPSDQFINQQTSWPSKGELQFNNVYMKYRENTDHILQGLTFSVKPSEKIGCVGRTGAGKTSIIQVLFRMVEIDKQAVPNSSITIDGIDTSTIGLHTLRKNLSIVPQTPLIFTGTVRKNLDPMGEYRDELLISTLQETNLWKHVYRFLRVSIPI